MESKIFVVGHCYLINDWSKKLTNQLNKIKYSSLYDKADSILMYLTDDKNQYDSQIQLYREKYPKIEFIVSKINYGEAILALRKICELSEQNENAKILFFHTKGVFNKYKNFTTLEIDELKIKGEQSWCDILDYFLMEKSEDCIEKLDSYDIVGATISGNWWWGNFWWVTSKHIRNNVHFDKFYNGSRWNCEAWVMESNKNLKQVKYFEFFHFYFDPLYSVVPRYFYDGTNLDSLNIEVIDAKYGFFFEQRDEGQGPKHNEDILIDVTEKVKNKVNENGNKSLVLTNYQHIDYNSFFGSDPAHGLPKKLRIEFKTNIDPHNVYVATSWESLNLINFGSNK